MKCDFEGCNEVGESQCIIIDLEGVDFERVFCKKHLKKMLWDEEANLK